MMKRSLEQALIEVWQQALIENAKVVELVPKHYPLRQTLKRLLRGKWTSFSVEMSFVD